VDLGVTGSCNRIACALRGACGPNLGRRRVAGAAVAVLTVVVI
jgi:hypothetical protein